MYINNIVKNSIDFGYNNKTTKTDDAIVDTGCERTTLSKRVYEWVKHHHPHYRVQTESIRVIGGNAIVLSLSLGAEDNTWGNKRM